MFWANNQHRIREKGEIFVVPHRCHCPANRERKLFGCSAGVIVNLEGRVATKKSDGALVWTKAFLDMQRLPRAFLLIFTYAKRVLRRMSQRRFGDLVRFGSTDIDDQQAQCPSDRCVGAKTMPERIMATVHTNSLSDRTVDDGEWSGRECGDV